MKEKEKTVSDYVNTDHLLASAAIVECLWSKFDALVPQRREGMSPLLTEAILFLKENIDLWSTIADIRNALCRVKNNERLQRALALKKLQELNGQEANIAVQRQMHWGFRIQTQTVLPPVEVSQDEVEKST